MVVAVRHSLSEVYPATPESVPAARSSAADFAADAGAPPETVEAVRLAVSEAVTNVVVHAYRGQAGDIHLTAAIAARELWVLVSDDGCGHQSPAERPGLGWGLALIAESSRDFLIAERANGGTELRMRFALASGSDDRCSGPRMSTTR